MAVAKRSSSRVKARRVESRHIIVCLRPACRRQFPHRRRFHRLRQLPHRPRHRLALRRCPRALPAAPLFAGGARGGARARGVAVGAGLDAG